TAESITSLDNPLVRMARSLQERSGRERQHAFLVEGLRLVEAAVAAATPQVVLHTAAFGAAGRREHAILTVARRSGVQVREVADRVLASVTATVTPQGGVAAMP